MKPSQNAPVDFMEEGIIKCKLYCLELENVLRR